jgi:SSS family solute:Na+ symporter
MAFLDWLVILIYLLGMLAIGVYYARFTDDEEDYLLGGRKMGAVSTGLSLFAALLSTISCLAVPGEMIQHGPMIFADTLTYPFVYLIVGWCLIPVFMKLRVTSAYEILEQRFGLGVRLLGSSLFLCMRLLWMSVIIYATTHEVLIPLTGLPEWTTPIACLAIGFVTVVYTSIGGLRAVVVTDVVQESILFGAMLLTLLLITVHLGGFSAWWPTQWMSHWDTFRLNVDTTARVNVPMAMLTGFLWWVCIAGSDQIAIQRYLSTPDLRTARRALAVSLIAGLLSVVLLALVGLALLAYFQAHPETLSAGTSVAKNADTLFARYIVIGLPTGVTGLVVAGLLATAMSSLSSGINSACSVITVDFIDRLRRNQPINEIDHVRRTKIISWSLGSAVVILSTTVGYFEGNLLEISFKAGNLLTAPLFLLLFLAIFIPQTTWLGAVAAVVASTVVAVGIAYFNWLGLSFIWILPASLLAGLIFGPIVSLIPCRPPRQSRSHDTSGTVLPSTLPD